MLLTEENAQKQSAFWAKARRRAMINLPQAKARGNEKGKNSS